MRKHEINLPPELEAFVSEQISQQRFEDIDSLVAHAVAMLQTATALEGAITRDNMPAGLRHGIEQAERGELFEADAVFAELNAEYDRDIERAS
jgi:Arc/MetJ-type ribon-helix-helix transcriptional regulator